MAKILQPQQWEHVGMPSLPIRFLHFAEHAHPRMSVVYFLVIKARIKFGGSIVEGNFTYGSIPGVTFDQMKLQIKLGVQHSLQQSLDIERVKSVFPYGKILNVEVVDRGLICSSGVCVCVLRKWEIRMKIVT
ncbi:hypothetical protein P3X46_033169 [Hevea brasiliensis]|uniref:Uncharacterized protein n=1 Tax=Hevea brasiliensis TaxID=3981 RepID=A0ABQ9KII8_HEVBR|nr:hypothetical protein P3X46_033169 [Hevea brasiliensis]